MLKHHIIFSCMLSFALSACAQNLLKNGDASAGMENWTGRIQAVQDPDMPGAACFKFLSGGGTSSELIQIEPAKTYKLSGKFKSSIDKKVKILLGLAPLDKNKKRILSQEVNIVSGTETVLVKACKASDKIIAVKDAGKWEVSGGGFIAFEIDASGAYKDIPNRNTSSHGITGVEETDGTWEIILENECGKFAPGGTPVRMHKWHCNYILPKIIFNFQSTKWKEFSGILTGEAKTGLAGNMFWNGTKFVQVAISSDEEVYVTGIVFEEIKPDTVK